MFSAGGGACGAWVVVQPLVVEAVAVVQCVALSSFTAALLQQTRRAVFSMLSVLASEQDTRSFFSLVCRLPPAHACQ